jgi:hypothetical protein
VLLVANSRRGINRSSFFASTSYARWLHSHLGAVVIL